MGEKKNSIVIINGRQYDAITGLPMAQKTTPSQPATTQNTPAAPPRQPRPAPPKQAPKPAAPAPMPTQPSKRVMSDVKPSQAGPKANTGMFTPARMVKKPAPPSRTATPHHVAQQVHRTPQRSQTLHRRATQKPGPLQATGKSPMISRFAPHPKPLQHTAQQPAPAPPAQAPTPSAPPAANQPAPQPAPQNDAPATPPKPAPVNKAQPQPQVPLSSRALKEQLIKERLAEVDTQQQATEPSESSLGKFLRLLRKPRAVHITAAALGLLLLGGYFAYINMPNLSVRVAASRAGVQASYPEYTPNGYDFDGPVAYAPGEVLLEFDSNTNDHSYSITQRASNWDSQAVLDNYVAQKSDSYLTYSEQGITIYTFDNQAAWVNHGTLYTIEGNAPLSSEQVLRIAASL